MTAAAEGKLETSRLLPLQGHDCWSLQRRRRYERANRCAQNRPQEEVARRSMQQEKLRMQPLRIRSSSAAKSQRPFEPAPSGKQLR